MFDVNEVRTTTTLTPHMKSKLNQVANNGMFAVRLDDLTSSSWHMAKLTLAGLTFYDDTTMKSMKTLTRLCLVSMIFGYFINETFALFSICMIITLAI